jgi:uncharacterized protein YbaR (Trm112 family)
MKQTAVEWLIEMLYSPVCKGFIEGRTQIPFHIIEQAKKMEEEQTMKAYKNGYVVQRVSKQTFNTNEK